MITNFILNHPFWSLIIVLISFNLFVRTVEETWVMFFQLRWRKRKCVKNKHKWGSNTDISNSERNRITSLFRNAANDSNHHANGLAKYYVGKLDSGVYILKSHKCEWCGKEDWTYDYDYDKLNKQESRDRKIDELLK